MIDGLIFQELSDETASQLVGGCLCDQIPDGCILEEFEFEIERNEDGTYDVEVDLELTCDSL